MCLELKKCVKESVPGVPLSHAQIKICCKVLTPVPNCDGQHRSYNIEKKQVWFSILSFLGLHRMTSSAIFGLFRCLWSMLKTFIWSVLCSYFSRTAECVWKQTETHLFTVIGPLVCCARKVYILWFTLVLRSCCKKVVVESSCSTFKIVCLFVGWKIQSSWHRNIEQGHYFGAGWSDLLVQPMDDGQFIWETCCNNHYLLQFHVLPLVVQQSHNFCLIISKSHLNLFQSRCDMMPL